MNSQTRLLPRLDQLYLQKQSYQAHQKKLTSIRHSGSLSKRSLNSSHLHQNQQQTKSLQSLSQSTLKLIELASPQKPYQIAPENRMETIQQAKPGLSYWLKKMNPLQKRLKQQQIKQNKRIRQKIKNTMSFVVKSNKLDSHAEHYKGIKNMLNKFEIDHDSKKTKLKCEIVLQKITEIEKQKLKIQQSRILQFQKNQKPSERILKMTKNTQNLTQFDKNQRERSSDKRNRMLSENINLVTRRSTGRMQNTAIVHNNRTMKNNLVHHKESILTRNKSEFTSKTNSLARNPKDSNTFMQKLGNSSNYQRIKTEHYGRNEPKRLFNSSKLSNLSTQTTPQPKLNKQYKMLRVNFTQKVQGFKRIPNDYNKKRYENQQSDSSRNQSEIKKHIASRIKTQVTQQSRAQRINKETNIKRFDYQKKRIQRYIKSKSSLAVKDASQIVNKIKNSQKFKDKVQTGQEVRTMNQKRPSIVQEKIEESMQTIDVGKKQEQTTNKKDQMAVKKGEAEYEAAYFATEIA